MYRIQRVLLLPLGGKLFWYERLSQLLYLRSEPVMRERTVWL